MSKTPKWKQDFNRRMSAQLRLFAKSKDKPEHLTKWQYTNGRVELSRYSYGRKVYRWLPKPKEPVAQQDRASEF